MKAKIWKYGIKQNGTHNTSFPASVFEVQMPEGAKVIYVGEQNKDICLWVIVNPQAPMVPRYFDVVMTGEERDIFGMNQYVGSAQVDWIVGHVFEVL